MPGANAGTLGAVKGFFGVSETYDAKYAVSTVLKNPSGTVLYEIRERDAGHWYIGDLCTCAFWCKSYSICNVDIVEEFSLNHFVLSFIFLHTIFRWILSLLLR